MDKSALASIVFLDACRNNPVLAQPLAHSLSSLPGWTAGSPVKTANLVSFISFAAAPDTIALDGDEPNPPYTEALNGTSPAWT